jgi:hypothetical protein
MALEGNRLGLRLNKAMPLLTVRQGRTEPTVVAEEAEEPEAVTTPTVFRRPLVAAVAPHMARPAEEAVVAVVEVLEVVVAKEAVVHLASSFMVQASQSKRRS